MSQPTIGCGIDVVEVARFRRALQRGGDALLKKIFTSRERLYARRRARTAILHLAARFAAKEAVIKAVSQLRPTRTLAMRQIEVHNDRWGRPSIILHDGSVKGITIAVSLSHANTVAVASAIAMTSRG